jgi:DNA-binding protein WhiA
VVCWRLSFSAATKNELARIYSGQTCCQKAELAAIIRFSGKLDDTEKNPGSEQLLITTENAAVARKTHSLLKSFAGIRGEVRVKRKTRLRKNNVYSLQVGANNEVKALINELEIKKKKSSPKAGLLKKECCRRAYLRGVFMCCGSVNNPEGDYHLEMTVNSHENVHEVHRLMRRLNLSPKNSSRKNKQVVYLKGRDQIGLFLNVVGAHGALLDFENTRIFKDMRNQVNRLVNCETANLHKTVNASVRQLESIKLIKEKLGLEKIPVSMREVAELRIKYPDASLKELGGLMEIPLSKSGVSHRLRKIDELAESISCTV